MTREFEVILKAVYAAEGDLKKLNESYDIWVDSYERWCHVWTAPYAQGLI